MTERLLAATFLFRFSAPCRYSGSLRSGNPKLGPRHAVPCLGALEEQSVFGELRAAWHPRGLAFHLQVRGKNQPPWCRENRSEDSDGLQLWIDTRDAHNIHRATRFCHHFVFLPEGAGARFEKPVARLININRARENPQPVAPEQLVVRSSRRRDGYALQAMIPASALTGFAPDEQPRLGFSYAVIDRELGTQAFTVGTEFPVREDPSLWGTLELMKD